MLVLTRKLNQRVHLSHNIVIQVLEIDRGQVKLGITAPPGIEILREELLDPEHPTNKEAPRGHT